jgi:preprotein translocase subunit SecY
MGRVKFFESLRNMRRLPDRWRKAGLVVGGLLLCEIGARIAAPGLGRALSQYFRQGGGQGLLWLYDRLVGGALSRGAVLALGIMPYLSARIFVRIARMAIPAVADMNTHPDGRARLTRWTRALTVGLSLVQSYGVARFAQSLPGVVAIPGPGFVPQTMLVLTAGAVVAMFLGEQITSWGDADDSLGAEVQDIRSADGTPQVASLAPQGASLASQGASLALDEPGALLLPPATHAVREAFEQRREPVGVPRSHEPD